MTAPAFPTVRVAAIQATPAMLDAERCVEKASRLLHEAAERHARLAVLPECCIPMYPSNAWARGRGGAAVIEDVLAQERPHAQEPVE